MPRRTVIAILLLIALMARALAPGVSGVGGAMADAGVENCHLAAVEQDSFDAAAKNTKSPPGGQRHDHANCVLCQISWIGLPTLTATPGVHGIWAISFEALHPTSRLVAYSLLNRGSPPRAPPVFL